VGRENKSLCICPQYELVFSTAHLALTRCPKKLLKPGSETQEQCQICAGEWGQEGVEGVLGGSEHCKQRRPLNETCDHNNNTIRESYATFTPWQTGRATLSRLIVKGGQIFARLTRYCMPRANYGRLPFCLWGLK
jgi:hypothetical protein